MKHKLDIKSRSCSTACSIQIVAYYPMSDEALPVNSPIKITCFVDWIDVIDCPKCLALIGK